MAGVDGMIEPEQAVNAVVETIRAERFLVLPHPEVAEYTQRKTADYDRWLGACAGYRAYMWKPSNPQPASASR